jgi:hypothetical protein
MALWYTSAVKVGGLSEIVARPFMDWQQFFYYRSEMTGDEE